MTEFSKEIIITIEPVGNDRYAKRVGVSECVKT